MSWIKSIEYDESDGRLRTIYDRIKGPDDYLDNILKVHGLRPHTLEGHMALYKNVLHHSANQVPKWLLEAVGVYVSILNACEYCVAHHLRGLARLLTDEDRAAEMLSALRAERFTGVFDERERAALHYVKTLTREPHAVGTELMARMREVGWDDGEILEFNQVAAYFAYANRTVLGLGVNADGDVLGLSPGSGDESWAHD